MEIGGAVQFDSLLSTLGTPLAAVRSPLASSLPTTSDGTPAFASLLVEQMKTDQASISVTIDRQVADCAELLDPKELAKIKDTAQQFESLLLYSLLKQMWATLPENSMLEQGMAAQFYREMWLEELAGQISTDGPGLGVAKAVEREMITFAARTITPAAPAAG